MRLRPLLPLLLALGLSAAGCAAILGIDGEVIDPELGGGASGSGDLDAGSGDERDGNADGADGSDH